MWIVGYEGARSGALMTYGAAAIEMENGHIMNAVSPGDHGIERVKFSETPVSHCLAGTTRKVLPCLSKP